VLIGEKKESAAALFFLWGNRRRRMREGLHFLRRAEDSAGPVYAFFPRRRAFFPEKTAENKTKLCFFNRIHD
jgi:hypothetical protein